MTSRMMISSQTLLIERKTLLGLRRRAGSGDKALGTLFWYTLIGYDLFPTSNVVADVTHTKIG